MRVLIYTKAFAPMVGGVETYVMLLASGLVQKTSRKVEDQVDVTVVTTVQAASFDDSALAFRVLRRPSFGILVRLIREADVVHLAGPCFVPMLLGLFLRKKVVVEHHGYQAACPNGLLFFEPKKEGCPGYFMARRYDQCLKCNAQTFGWLASAWMLFVTFPRRFLCQHVSTNVPITNHVLQRLRLRNSRVIYYGVPESRASGSVNEATTAGGLPAVCFAYVGRLVKEKGPKLVLEAVARLRTNRVRLRIKFIGDGPERLDLERTTAASGLQDCVTFTGFLEGDSLIDALHEVTAIIMPSLMEETAGLAALEQMMRGRLVIASDVGGLGEIVDGVGLKFSPGDVGGLVQCLRRVLDEPSLVAELGRAARQRALQMFGQQRMVEVSHGLYGHLLGKVGEFGQDEGASSKQLL